MLTALLALVSSSTLAAPVEIKMVFTEGQTYAFNQITELEMSADAMGEKTESTIKIESRVTYTYSNVRPDGTADLTVVDETMKMEVETDGEEEETELPGKTTTTAKIDAFGKLSDVKTEDEDSEGEEEEGEDPFTAMLTSAFGSDHSFLPKSAVEVGAKWATPVEEKQVLFREGAVINLTFLGTETVAGKSLFRIDSMIDEKLDFDFAKMMGSEEMGEMRGKGNLKSEGKGWVLPNGHTYKAENTFEMSLSIPLMGEEFTTKMKGKMLSTLVE